ncbi:hypothetical protein K469DRAFT_89480 [Zopfia rhizophila CBS 207.26]|uniref:Uncharacterized protein n=1 Tax=Zopfia rhizophila CBS 207.26 TaxID=1314779 RepID=A0A6A6EBD6_9PEZI|nr:hypothetical protein K469DRAFT_89480 [Zopfia rhizophila CBS 207.26]
MGRRSKAQAHLSALSAVRMAISVPMSTSMRYKYSSHSKERTFVLGRDIDIPYLLRPLGKGIVLSVENRGSASDIEHPVYFISAGRGQSSGPRFSWSAGRVLLSLLSLAALLSPDEYCEHRGHTSISIVSLVSLGQGLLALTSEQMMRKCMTCFSMPHCGRY